MIYRHSLARARMGHGAPQRPRSAGFGGRLGLRRFGGEGGTLHSAALSATFSFAIQRNPACGAPSVEKTRHTRTTRCGLGGPRSRACISPSLSSASELRPSFFLLPCFKGPPPHPSKPMGCRWLTEPLIDDLRFMIDDLQAAPSGGACSSARGAWASEPVLAFAALAEAAARCTPQLSQPLSLSRSSAILLAALRVWKKPAMRGRPAADTEVRAPGPAFPKPQLSLRASSSCPASRARPLIRPSRWDACGSLNH